MKQRLNHGQILPDFAKKVGELGYQLEKSVGESLFGLVHNRVSQMNGCAFCVDMDVKKAKLRGESLLKMYHVAVWRDSQLFSEKERAALEWAESVTHLPAEGISDELYNRMREIFSEKELVELTGAITITNVWNRLNAAFRTTPGQLDKVFGLDKAGLD